MTQLQITFPWPPTVNHYWRHANNRTFISKRGIDYRNQVSCLLLPFKACYIASERLSLKIDAYPPDKRKRDLDNILKALLDSLQHGGLYADDNQIDRLCIERMKEIRGEVVIYIDSI